MSCYVSNKSSNFALALNQYMSLCAVAGEERLVDTGSDDAVPIELDSLKAVIDVLPMEFAVTCPESRTPIVANETAIKKLDEHLAVLDTDVVAQVLYSKYIGGDQVVAIIYDMADRHPETNVLNNLVKGFSGKVLILLVNSTDKETLSLPEKHAHVTTVPIDALTATYLARKAPAQFITGGLYSWWAAQGRDEVFCPSPLLPGKELTLNPKWKLCAMAWAATEYFDRVYYVNLAKRTDRRAQMEEELQKKGLLAARVEAVDGQTQIKWDAKFGLKTQFWNNGAFAHCLSYRVAIIDAMKNGYDKVLILEDDAVLSDEFYSVLAGAFASLPADWHLLYLAANHGCPKPTSMPRESDRIGDYLYRLSGSLSAHAIILNKRAFPILLNHLSNPCGPIDNFLAMYQRFFPCYITYPGLAYQRASYSNITEKNIDYTADWGIDYIHHIECRRPIKEVSVVKEDVSAVKADVSAVKENVSAVKENVSVVKAE